MALLVARQPCKALLFPGKTASLGNLVMCLTHSSSGALSALSVISLSSALQLQLFSTSCCPRCFWRPFAIIASSAGACESGPFTMSPLESYQSKACHHIWCTGTAALPFWAEASSTGVLLFRSEPIVFRCIPCGSSPSCCDPLFINPSFRYSCVSVPGMDSRCIWPSFQFLL